MQLNTNRGICWDSSPDSSLPPRLTGIDWYHVWCLWRMVPTSSGPLVSIFAHFHLDNLARLTRHQRCMYHRWLSAFQGFWLFADFADSTDFADFADSADSVDFVDFHCSIFKMIFYLSCIEAEMSQTYKWMGFGFGWDWDGNLCAHRFYRAPSVLIIWAVGWGGVLYSHCI